MFLSEDDLNLIFNKYKKNGAFNYLAFCSDGDVCQCVCSCVYAPACSLSLSLSLSRSLARSLCRSHLLCRSRLCVRACASMLSLSLSRSLSLALSLSRALSLTFPLPPIPCSLYLPTNIGSNVRARKHTHTLGSGSWLRRASRDVCARGQRNCLKNTHSAPHARTHTNTHRCVCSVGFGG